MEAAVSKHMKKLWVITLVGFVTSLIAGRQAIFTNGGNGNGEWYLLFWFTTVTAGISNSLMISRSLCLSEVKTAISVALVAGILLLFSSPLGLMAFFALPLLFAFFVLVLVSLIWFTATSRLKDRM